MDKVNIAEIDKRINDYDVFICSTSFENRCLQIANYLDIEQFNTILVCHFNDNYPESNANLSIFQQKFGSKCKVLSLEKDSPLYKERTR